jgi:hypothetical protein
MRRSVIGGIDQHGPQLSPTGNKSLHLSERSSLSPGVMSSATSPSSFNNQIPPILPAKPYGPSPGIGGGPHHIFGHLTPSSSHGSSPSPHLLQGKPLPPRPSSTNSAMLSSSVSSSPMLIKPVALNNINNCSSVREGNLYTPPHQQYLHQNATPPGVNHFAINQRSVPNLPQLLHPMNNNNSNNNNNLAQQQLLRPNSTHQQQQQPQNPPFGHHPQSQFYQNNNSNINNNNSPHKRLFLSPQPHESPRLRVSNASSNFGGSSGNLLSENETPYYSELTLSPPKSSPGFMPAHIPFPLNNVSGRPGPGPPPPMANHGIGVGQPPQSGQPRVRVEWKSVDNLQKHNGPRLTTTGKEIDIGPVEVGIPNKELSQNDGGFKVNHPPMSTLFSGSVNPEGFHNHSHKTGLPAKSPEYDMIRTPSEIAKEMKERFSSSSGKVKDLSVHYVEPSSGQASDMNDSGKDSSVSAPQTSNDSDTVVTTNTLNTTLCQLAVVGGKNGTESTDCSSLGRSSTSDGDFGTLGGNVSSGGSSMYTENAG